MGRRGYGDLDSDGDGEFIGVCGVIFCVSHYVDSRVDGAG